MRRIINTKKLLLLSRSLVFKKGQLLEVSHNFLKDASTIDASEYTSMNIFCNYAAEKEQTEECSITSIPEGGVFSKNIIKSYFKNVRIRSPQKNFKKGKNVIDEFLENTSLPIFFLSRFK